MRKILLFLIIFFYIINVNASDDESCKYYYSKYQEYDEWWNKENSKYYYNKYNDCLDEIYDLFNNWYDSYIDKKYDNSIEYYKKYLEKNWDKEDENYIKAKWNLILSYNKLWDVYLNKKDYNNAINNFLEVIKLDNENISALWWLWICYYLQLEYDKALNYYNEWLKYATDNSVRKSLQEWIETIENDKKNAELIKNASTNDLLSYLQYYSKQLNIPNAWNKVKNNNQVIVAVIDDWISINHPDLTNNIWVNQKAKYWDSKIIDFVWDWLVDNATTWDHWTMIAWIIWATRNNNEWVAWIANNVKLMPLRVFDTDLLATEQSILDAMNYAIDNWANIINLSLWFSQFEYSDKFDEVIKKAYDNWVVVVIAAWNWDLLSWWQNWVNLDINPIPPVCNNENKYKYSIWVYATDENWYRTNWSNYWNCAQFWAPWVWIVSTSIPVYNSNYWDNYNIWDWTSFSAPIITWIIALWYNQYWWVDPVYVYDALYDSYISYKLPDWQTWYKIDASKYLDKLWEKIKLQKENQTKIDNENKLKQKSEVVFNQIKSKFSKYSDVKKKKTYELLLKTLNWYKTKIKSWDKLIIINHLIYLINNEIK